MWKNSTRWLEVCLLIVFLLFLSYESIFCRSMVRAGSGPIDNYSNVENYTYRYETARSDTVRLLRDCEYSFCDWIDIPGMPETKQKDFLNQFIFSESQCPQGLCVTEQYVLVTSYSQGHSCKGELMVIDRESGTFLATLGMDAKSHLGGIAYDGTNVWVCNSSNGTVERISYDFIELMADANKRGVVDATGLVDEYEVKNSPSCITYYGGRLWVATHTKVFGSKMIAYHLDAKNQRLEALSEYRIPAKVQGLAFDDEGSVYLSTSYGRYQSSYLKIYESLIALSSNPNTPNLEIEMPPGSEEVDLREDVLYVIFESAGEKYYEGTDGKGQSLCPLDKILQIKELS